MKLKVESRPDTDDIENNENKWYSNADHLVFYMCDKCRNLPGNPTLCPSCYHNRRVVDELRKRSKLSPKYWNSSRDFLF